MRSQALMYHGVVDGDESAAEFGRAGAPDVYAVTGAAFREQLDAIARRTGSDPVAVSDLESGEADGWLLTFDDGGSSSVPVGEELARRGWRGHFFIVTGLVGEPGFVTWDEVRRLAALGHVIGSHTHTHPARISSRAPGDIRDEWETSRAALSEAIGAPVTTASVPGGYYSRGVAEAAAATGLTSLFTSDPTRRVRRGPGGILLVGRYAIRDATTADQAAAAATGDPAPWRRQAAAWRVRAAVKRVGGRHYDRLRSALLRNR